MRGDKYQNSDDVALGNPATSGKAVVGLVCALATCCLPGIMLFPALIFSILAMMDISREPGKYKGMWMAVTGLVFGLLGNAFGALAWYFCIVGAFVGTLLAIIGLTAGEAERVATTANVNQLSLAVFKYEGANKTFPAPSTPGGLSWRVSILPYIEQNQLFARFDQQAAWDAGANKQLLNDRPMFFESKMHTSLDRTLTPFQTTVGPNGLFKTKDSVVRVGDVKGGLSNTIFFIDTTSHVPWTQPTDLTIDNALPLPSALPNDQFLVGMLDGSVRMINRKKINDQTLRQLFDPNNGQVVPQNLFE